MKTSDNYFFELKRALKKLPHKGKGGAVFIFIISFALFTGCSSKGGDSISKSASHDLKEFESLSISIASGDIEIAEGDKFSLSYDLHSKEKVEIMEVKDGVFTFKTDIDFKFKPDAGDFYLKVTLPKDKSLKEINLSTAAGDILIDGRNFENAEIKTVSGDIELENLKGNTVLAKTTSGEIDFSDCDILDLEAESVSDDINLEGNFENVRAKSVSGDILLEGNVKEKARLETVSGKVKTDFPLAYVEASTVGNIEYKGNSFKGKIKIDGTLPSLFAKSVSGSVKIS